jgi:hypothetical protein
MKVPRSPILLPVRATAGTSELLAQSSPAGITVLPLRRPSENKQMPERCSPARVRYAAQTAARPCLLRSVPVDVPERRAAPAGTQVAINWSSTKNLESQMT